MRSTIKILLLVFFTQISTAVVSQTKNTELILLDREGVMRWQNSKKEISLFGANYCLPSACDYRAAGYFTNDRKKAIEDDMLHFARMGWDGLRVCLWGDWENSDSLGNLINNDHLDLMDYLIFKAKERGIYMLLSPIVTYSAQWPDAMGTPSPGFSSHFKKSELGKNPNAIKAQTNYIRQLLEHSNPYTKTKIKDEPNILFIEMINEPTHHPKDKVGSVNYINALVDAVRSTGCKKVVFHNVSQDFEISKALEESKIQGVSFAWYPSGLNSGRTLDGNFLRSVDRYDSMLKPELKKLAKIVYEFDQPDLLSPTLYPAMVRTFRSVGAQFASIFSYDMLVSASHNLGWQTHFINLVNTPQKAVSAIIAAEAMRQLPLMKSYGEYPNNATFGNFRISYEENISELSDERKFYYAGNTRTSPRNQDKLEQIVGFGSSPVVSYDGTGSYFIDKINDGIWRLEVYPDIAFVNDPFEMPSPDKIVSRIIYNQRAMRFNLKNLGNTFDITGLNEGNNFSATTTNGSIAVKPGVYLLKRKGVKSGLLPQVVRGVGLKEFVAPKAHDLPLQFVISKEIEILLDSPARISIDLIDDQPIDSVFLFIRSKGSRFRKVSMSKRSNYTYEAILTGEINRPGFFDYHIVAYQGKKPMCLPSGEAKHPMQWDFTSRNPFRLNIIAQGTPFEIFSPLSDVDRLSFTRIGDNIRWGIFRLDYSSSGDPVFCMSLPDNLDHQDYTASILIKNKIRNHKQNTSPKSLLLKAKSAGGDATFFITLVESDGTSWTKEVQVNENTTEQELFLSDFVQSKGVLLPTGYPGQWNYWVQASATRDAKTPIDFSKVEQLQFSVRPWGKQNNAVEISSVKVIPETN